MDQTYHANTPNCSTCISLTDFRDAYETVDHGHVTVLTAMMMEHASFCPNGEPSQPALATGPPL